MTNLPISQGDSASVEAAIPRSHSPGRSTRERLLRAGLRNVAKFGGEAAWIGAGQVAAALGMVVGVRILTGLLTPAEYGKLALGITITMLNQQVLAGPLGVASQRFFSPSCEEHQLGGFLLALRQWGGRMLLAMAAMGGLTLAVCLAAGWTSWVALIFIAFLYAAICGGNSLFDGLQMAARHRPVVAWHQAAGQWGRFACAAVMVVYISASGAVALLGYTVATVVILVSQWVFFRRKIASLQPAKTRASHNHNVAHWRRAMFHYMWPLSMWGVVTWMHMATDRWALQSFSGLAQVGFYAVLFQLGYYPIVFASGLMLQLICPVVFQRAGNARDATRMRDVRRIVLAIGGCSLGLTLVAFLLMALLHRLVFTWLADEQFHQISYLLPWMTLAGGMFATAQALSVNQMAQVTTRKLIAPKITTAVVGILLSICGAAWYGVVGVVCASCAFSGLYLFWMLAMILSTDRSKSPHPIAETTC